MKTTYSAAAWRQQCEALERVFDAATSRPFESEAERQALRLAGIDVRYQPGLNGTTCCLRHYIELDGEPRCAEITYLMKDPVDMIAADRAEYVHRDELERDFLTGLKNNRAWEGRFCLNLAQWAQQGTPAAVARVDIDHYAAIVKEYGEENAQQLLVFVANQWKKHTLGQPNMLLARLLGHSLYIGVWGMNAQQLEALVRQWHAEIPTHFMSTTGMMRPMHYTATAACAGLDEVEPKSWSALYNLCANRLMAQKRAQRGAVYRISE